MQYIENCNVSLSSFAVAVGEDVQITVTCEQGKVLPTQGVLQRSTEQKMGKFPFCVLCCTAALCVNTLLGNSCFRLLHCVT